ncbi:MAG: hypothetical protein JWQ63_3925 [Mucilaginibacter sp.]|nr:hypothetical protein [Mucilaginibacter sp.]
MLHRNNLFIIAFHLKKEEAPLEPILRTDFFYKHAAPLEPKRKQFLILINSTNKKNAPEEQPVYGIENKKTGLAP